uniref:Uncharacterized protein n=1 Tax=Lactuca sativa TaxID=4236 RepID=A0A9R1WGI6_LACSA|nr:hypothetical protein LSAT_V11C200094060 [Lactuca sativa]
MGFYLNKNEIFWLCKWDVTTYSWTWFLEQLGVDLELYANSDFTFISDRQKWKDKELKDFVWACATATIVRYFEKALEELKKFNVEAHDWLL